MRQISHDKLNFTVFAMKLPAYKWDTKQNKYSHTAFPLTSRTQSIKSSAFPLLRRLMRNSKQKAVGPNAGPVQPCVGLHIVTWDSCKWCCPRDTELGQDIQTTQPHPYHTANEAHFHFDCTLWLFKLVHFNIKVTLWWSTLPRSVTDSLLVVKIWLRKALM